VSQLCSVSEQPHCSSCSWRHQEFFFVRCSVLAFMTLLLCFSFTAHLLARPCLLLPADANLEDNMSADDMPPARPAPVPASTNRRVRVMPSSRRRPPLAPGTKAAADGGKQQKGATTASGRRSFLTLAVSTGE
jgi:hypothetical protein